MREVSTLTPERWKKVEEVFESVLERPPSERAAFLESVCQDDLSLRNQVETLLQSLQQAGSTIDSPAFGAVVPETVVEAPFMIGKRLGAYRIEQEVGRGGMGSVYLAVRADDEFHKRVAIKLIKRGMDTDFIIRRFRNERQILASLDHPHIARLLDGGTTEDGLPYFVMEYVEGQPVYHYSDTQRLSITNRLRLFRDVCSAVQYAHQNLVIHRDLKPSNVMVTPEGVPKLLDFGIAKLLNPEMATHTLDPTTAAIRLMTPEYASPEQVRGEGVTVASDVYSLGVMLYELLTDHRPYRLWNHSPLELARVICEEEPELPSVAVNLIEVIPTRDGEPIEVTPETVSVARSTTPDQLRRELSGSLDNIVLKAMHKDPAQRYPSVEEFSEDIRRYLEGHPVSAPSYFSTKSELETAELASTSRSIAVLPFQVLRKEEKSDEFLGMGMADAIITKLSNIQRIVVRPTSSVVKYFDGTHNILAAGHELNVGYVLDGRIQRAGDRIRVTVQLVRIHDGAPLWATKLDENFTDIFAVEDSISQQVADALVPRLTGEERQLLLRHETEKADAYQAFLKGRFFWNRFTPEDFARAVEQFREAIRLDPNYAQAYVGVADYYNWAAIFGLDNPTECFSQSKAAAIRALELDEQLAEAHAALAFTNLCYDWDWEASEHRFRRSLELNPNYGNAHQWYSNLLAAQGRFAEAIAEIKRAQEINPLSLMDRSIAGWTYYHGRRYQLAENELLAILEIDRNFSNSHLMLGLVYERLGRYQESITELNCALELMAGSVVPLWALGYTLAVSGKPAEALDVIQRLKERRKQQYVSPYFIALVYVALGDRDAAFEWLEQAYQSRDEWLIWLGVEPKLDPIRSDPRFQELLRRVGLKGDEAAKAISSSGDYGRDVRSGKVTGENQRASTAELFPGAVSLSSGPVGVGRGRWWKRTPLLVVVATLVVLLAAIGGYRLLRTPVTHFRTTRTDRLTASGNVIAAAISRDGRHAAFVIDEAGKQGVWVRQMAVGNSIRIVPPADTDYRGLTFSPDGAYIYYVVPGKDSGPGELYQVPAFGGSVKQVGRAVDSGISFSPDGKKFAFIRSNAAAGEDWLVITNADGRGEQQIAVRKFPEHLPTFAAPAWSPDGERLLCVVQTGDNSGVFMKPVEVRLSDRAENALGDRRWLEIREVAWIADGSGVVMTAQDDTSGFLHVWYMNYPAGQLRRITSDVSDYRGVSIPASSDSILTIQRQTITNIFIAPKGDPGKPRQVSSGAGRFFDLSWTPDGKLLYASDASGGADLWEMETDGTGQNQLTAGAGRNYAPVSSPDGRYIFFHSNRSGSWQIWRMDRDGSNSVQMTTDKEESNWPEVSPDGKWLVYQHTTAGAPAIWKMPIMGGAAKPLISAFSTRAAFSPDGKQMAFWHKENVPNAPWRIAITLSEGGAPTKLLDVPQSPATANSVIQWTPDGRNILFVDFRAGVTNLMMTSVDTGQLQPFTKYSKEIFYSFDFSRDGRMVLSRGFWTNDAVLIREVR
ncbi:MAG TPA: protein kinase [Pyrinomonadaceae bacterium]|nr:protein kinase [Pyrinomonadaceae bacterium]